MEGGEGRWEWRGRDGGRGGEEEEEGTIWERMVRGSRGRERER